MILFSNRSLFLFFFMQFQKGFHLFLKSYLPLCNIYYHKISKLIAKDLKKENIFFAGIDFIDQKLNGDINVTSPTGLKTLYDLSGINLAKIFWKELKA